MTTISNGIEQKKITKWKKEPSLLDLKADLKEAEPYHNTQVKRIERWMDNMYVKGSAVIKGNTGRSKVVPKLIRKQAEWRYPALSEPFLSKDNFIKANPKTWEDAKNAEQASLLLNHYFNISCNKELLIDSSVRTNVDEGTIIYRTGWYNKTEVVKEMVPLYEVFPTDDPETAALMERLAEFETSNYTEFLQNVKDELLAAYEEYKETGMPHVAAFVSEEEQEVTKVRYNHPTADICAAEDVIIDPNCNGDIKKAKFVIHRYPSNKAELERIGGYHNLDKIEESVAGMMNKPDDALVADPNFGFKDEPRKLLTVYEYWGFYDVHDNNTLVSIKATWVGGTLIGMEENPFPDKELPFVVVQYLPVRRHIYGEPDGELLEDNQKINGAITRGVIDLLAKSANSQTGFRKGALDVINRKRFAEGKDYEFNPMGDPSSSIHTHKFPEIPSTVPYMLNFQTQDAEALSGVKSYSEGISGNSLGNVATAVRGALDAASKRELGILRRMAKGFEEISRKWLSMSTEFMEPEELVRITNDQFEAVRIDDIRGDFDITIEISTTDDDAKRSEELSFMLQTMGNTLPLAITKILMTELMKLKRLPQVAQAIEEYEPEPDPAEEQMKQLALAKAQMELEKLQAEIGYLHARAEETGASAYKTMNDAEYKRTQADLNNLNFVEQESGTKQERDIQRIQSQAMGNIELEKAKARIKEAGDVKKAILDYNFKR